MILFGDWSLRKAIYEFVEHCHRESNYPELGNRLIVEESQASVTVGLSSAASDWTEC